MPDLNVIRKTWREIVTNLGSLSERAEPNEVMAARNALKGLLGFVKVDRRGKGYADLTIGVPTSMVAGAGFGYCLMTIQRPPRTTSAQSQ